MSCEGSPKQFTSELRNRSLFLITNRSLTLQELNIGQTGTYPLTTNRTLNLHRTDRSLFLTVLTANRTLNLQGLFLLFWSPPLTCKVYCSDFGLTLGCFQLALGQGERQDNFNYPNADIQFSQHPLLNRLSPPQHGFSVSSSRIRWLWLRGLISGSSILFWRAACWRLRWHHTAFVAVALHQRVYSTATHTPQSCSFHTELPWWSVQFVVFCASLRLQGILSSL